MMQCQPNTFLVFWRFVFSSLRLFRSHYNRDQKQHPFHEWKSTAARKTIYAVRYIDFIRVVVTITITSLQWLQFHHYWLHMLELRSILLLFLFWFLASSAFLIPWFFSFAMQLLLSLKRKSTKLWIQEGNYNYTWKKPN